MLGRLHLFFRGLHVLLRLVLDGLLALGLLLALHRVAAGKIGLRLRRRHRLVVGCLLSGTVGLGTCLGGGLGGFLGPGDAGERERGGCDGRGQGPVHGRASFEGSPVRLPQRPKNRSVETRPRSPRTSKSRPPRRFLTYIGRALVVVWTYARLVWNGAGAVSERLQRGLGKKARFRLTVAKW